MLRSSPVNRINIFFMDLCFIVINYHSLKIKINNFVNKNLKFYSAIGCKTEIYILILISDFPET